MKTLSSGFRTFGLLTAIVWVAMVGGLVYVGDVTRASTLVIVTVALTGVFYAIAAGSD